MKRPKKKPHSMVISSFPPVKVVIPRSDEDHARIVAAQRDHALALADRIEAGEVLGDTDRQFAAVTIRAWANTPKTRKRSRGKPRTMDPGTVTLHFGQLVKVDGMSEAAAIGEIALIYETSEEGVRKAIKPHKRAVLDWFDAQVEQTKSVD